MAKTKLNHISKAGALKQLAEYIIDCESYEYDNYMTYCEENDLDPKVIRGLGQSNHVYAKALIGLGLEFPNEKENSFNKDDWGTCALCNATVHMDDFREHGAEHNPNAMNMPMLALFELFKNKE